MSSKKGLALLRRPEVERRTGLKSTQLDEKEKHDDFPKRVQISARAVGWVESEIDAWIHERIRARDTDPKRKSAPVASATAR